MDFPKTRQLLDAAIAARACPAATISVGRTAGPLWERAFGSLTYASDAPRCTLDTVFDLASLTKVIATTSLVMRQIARGHITLDTPIGSVLTAWTDGGRDRILVRHLLDHSSGLPAHARLWERAGGRTEYEAAIRALPLERQPGEASVYSDPGFMILGFLLEEIAGLPLDRQFHEVASDVGLAVHYLPALADRARIAPTEFDTWRNRLLVGEVHDENAAALGGVAGHAGLFGTVADVATFARLVLRTFTAQTTLGSPDLMRTFAMRTGVPGSSRALGWDTMLPTSSCGTRLTADAIGHTGFTGTSLWIDPRKDLYIALLTNRVHPTRDNERWPKLRPQIHDALIEDLEGSAGDR